MSIFVHKNYGGTKAGFYNFMIQVGIMLRAFVSAIGRPSEPAFFACSIAVLRVVSSSLAVVTSASAA